jgi:hypothetical protein
VNAEDDAPGRRYPDLGAFVLLEGEAVLDQGMQLVHDGRGGMYLGWSVTVSVNHGRRNRVVTPDDWLVLIHSPESLRHAMGVLVEEALAGLRLEVRP